MEPQAEHYLYNTTDRFVVDLSGLAYASSIGLRVLIRGAKAPPSSPLASRPSWRISTWSAGSAAWFRCSTASRKPGPIWSRAHRHRADDSPSSWAAGDRHLCTTC